MLLMILYHEDPEDLPFLVFPNCGTIPNGLGIKIKRVNTAYRIPF